MFPQGSINFIAAAVILTLKLWALPRFLWMPGMLCYLAASTVETALYLLGWPAAGWSAAVSALAVLAAMEVPGWSLGVQSDAERSAVRQWCWMLALVFATVGLSANGTVYPHYPDWPYQWRVCLSVFCVGYLIGLLGYCWANSLGVRRYVIHASILLLRLATFGALLLVHDRALWFTADLIGEAVNVLTLGAWLWLLPRHRVTVKPAV